MTDTLKEKTYSFPVPLFDWATLEIITTNDMPRSCFHRGLATNAAATTVAQGNTVTILINEELALDHLCHESVHAACEILKQSGVKQTVKNDEAIAYLAGWIGRMFESIKKQQLTTLPILT